MQLVGLGEPDMAINAGALVEPAVTIGGIDPDDQEIPAAVIEEVTDVELEWDVAAVVAPHVAAVEEHHCAAERPIELQHDTAIRVRGRDVEGAPIPTDRRIPVVAAERLVAVALESFVMDEWQLHRPIVRQIERPPGGIVAAIRGESERAGLREGIESVAGAEVAQRRRVAAEMEFPAEIEEEALARVYGRGGHGGHRLRGGGISGVTAEAGKRIGPSCHEWPGLECKAGAQQVPAGDLAHRPPSFL